jgi:hypothetical protein
MDSSLKLLRTVRLFLLATIVLYAAIAERFGPAPKAQAPIVFYAIAAVAISLIATMLAIRRGRLPKLEKNSVLRSGGHCRPRFLAGDLSSDLHGL